MLPWWSFDTIVALPTMARSPTPLVGTRAAWSRCVAGRPEVPSCQRKTGTSMPSDARDAQADAGHEVHPELVRERRRTQRLRRRVPQHDGRLRVVEPGARRSTARAPASTPARAPGPPAGRATAATSSRRSTAASARRRSARPSTGRTPARRRQLEGAARSEEGPTQSKRGAGPGRSRSPGRAGEGGWSRGTGEGEAAKPQRPQKRSGCGAAGVPRASCDSAYPLLLRGLCGFAALLEVPVLVRRHRLAVFLFGHDRRGLGTRRGVRRRAGGCCQRLMAPLRISPMSVR